MAGPSAAAAASPRFAQLGAQDRLRVREREGRQTVLQLREIGGDLGADNVGARRQELAELDVAGAELLQRGRQPLTGAQARDVAPRAEAQQRRPEPRQTRNAVLLLARDQRVVLCQHARGAQEPKETGERCDHDEGVPP